MRGLPLIWAVAGACVALAQSGSVTGVVLDSATQGPVRKAQVMLLYRGPASGMAVAQRGLAGGGAIGVAGTLFDPSAARAMGRVQAGVIAPAPARGLLMGPGGAPNQPSAALSDSGGGFVLRDVPPGMYTIQATHPRYPVRPGGPVGAEVEVKAGEAARVSISLTPGASLTGRILDEDGEPLQGCTVQLRSASSRQQWVGTVGSEMSNERGEYRLYGVQAGRYLAFASCGRPVFQPRPFSAGPPPPPSFAYPAVYYPQTADPSAASAIELSAGLERSGVDFQMTPARVFTVTGTVAGFDRQPAVS